MWLTQHTDWFLPKIKVPIITQSLSVENLVASGSAVKLKQVNLSFLWCCGKNVKFTQILMEMEPVELIQDGSCIISPAHFIWDNRSTPALWLLFYFSDKQHKSVFVPSPAFWFGN